MLPSSFSPSFHSCELCMLSKAHWVTFPIIIPHPLFPSCLIVRPLSGCAMLPISQQLAVTATRRSDYFYGETMFGFPVAQRTCFNFCNWLQHYKLQHTDPSCGHDSSFWTQESKFLQPRCGLHFLHSGEKCFTYVKALSGWIFSII